MLLYQIIDLVKELLQTELTFIPFAITKKGPNKYLKRSFVLVVGNMRVNRWLVSQWGRKQPSFQSLLNLLISHNRSKRGFFLNRHIPINSCCFSVDWSINWCKWCRSFYPRSRNATYSLDTLLYSLLKYESRPSNSDCLSSFVTSVQILSVVEISL